MPSDTIDIQVATERADRRELLERFCDELSRALAGDRPWESDGFLVPWHVSASEFALLPAQMVAAIIDEWDEAGGQLAGIEFSGYLETDHGSRAWGSLMMRNGAPRDRAPKLEACTVARTEDGYRIDARLRMEDGTDD